MLITLSPAKTLDYETPPYTAETTQPLFLKDSQLLVDILKKKNASQLSSLFHVSSKLGTLNYERFQHWKRPFTTKNAKQAIFTFNGPVYTAFDFEKYDKKAFTRLQDQVRLLSGLHGYLRPFDLIQPYRLEMGTKLANSKGEHLYAFWMEKVTTSLNKEKATTLVNLASKEYADVIDYKTLNKKVITPVFKDYKAGAYKTIGVLAKRARGLFADWIVREQIKEQDLNTFSVEGYKYSKNDSDDTTLVFLRKK